jgi:hypothetical protein
MPSLFLFSHDANKMTEVQKHGFTWEKDLLCNVYRVDPALAISYTAKMDCPAESNKLDGVALSIKTSGSGSKNVVYMGDVLRFYDETHSGTPFHLVVVFYDQTDAETKTLTEIVEVDLTDSGALLFGGLTRDAVAALDAAVKRIPQKRSPTPEERAAIYALRDTLQSVCGDVLHLDIKCNSQQSRIQSHFNGFQRFLTAHPARVVARSGTCEFRGGRVAATLTSRRRVLKRSVA